MKRATLSLLFCSFSFLASTSVVLAQTPETTMKVETLYTSDHGFHIDVHAHLFNERLKFRALGEFLFEEGFGKRELRATVRIPSAPRNLSLVGEYRWPENSAWEYGGAGMQIDVLRFTRGDVSATGYLTTKGPSARSRLTIEGFKEIQFQGSLRWYHNRGTRIKVGVERFLTDRLAVAMEAKWRSWNEEIEVAAGIGVVFW